MTNIESKVESQLLPFAQQLLNMVETAKINLDKYDKEKKDIIESTLKNLMSSFDSVTSLNAAVNF